MAYTPNTNQQFQVGDTSSIYAHKESYRKFLEDLAQLDLQNIVKDSQMNLWNGLNLPIYWSTDTADVDFNEIVSGPYTGMRKITLNPIGAGTNSGFSQEVTTEIKADTIYTAVLNVFNPGNIPLVFSIEASGNTATMFKDLNISTPTLDIAAVSISGNNNSVQKGVVQFKTVASIPATGAIILKISYTDPTSASHVIYLDSVSLYRGSIELAYTPDPIIRTGPQGYQGEAGLMGVGTDTFNQDVWIVNLSEGSLASEYTYPFSFEYYTGGVEVGRHLQIFQNGQRLVPEMVSRGVTGEYREIEASGTPGIGNSVTFKAGILNYGDTIVFMMGGIGGATSAVASTSVPIGMINWFANDVPPADWLACDGQILAKVDYNTLYGSIGDKYLTGSISADYFQLPDLRGKFVRGWAASGGIDTGRVFGTTQADDFKSHSHPISASITSVAGDGINSYPAHPLIGDVPEAASTQINSTDPGHPGTETRPINIALLPCIKAKGNVETVSFTTGVEVGTVATFITPSFPASYLECNGQWVDKIVYPALFNAVGYRYGTNGNYFKLPDYRGMFLRGIGNTPASSVDPEWATRYVGDYQPDSIQGHKHTVAGGGSISGWPMGYVAGGMSSRNTEAQTSSSPITDGINGTPNTSAETRPKNMSVIYAIKAYDTDINYLNYATSATIAQTVPASGIISISNHATSGYTELPGGLFMQWGTVIGVSAGASATFSFPRPFVMSVLNASATVKMNSNIVGATVGVFWTGDTTKMTVWNNHASSALDIAWTAIGY
jgi:microcystin-dependent protein